MADQRVVNGTSVPEDAGRAWALRLFHRQLALKRWLRSGARDAAPPDVAAWPEGIRLDEPLPSTLSALAVLVEGRFNPVRSA